MNSCRIIVFAKAPLPGRVKTRLIPALGADGAAALAREMLERTLAAALDAGLGPVELCGDPSPDDAPWADVVLPAGIERSAQGAGDLGVRMSRAAQRALARGERVLVVGTDCAQMSAALLRQAAGMLDGAEVVIGPVADGGYALIGLSRHDERLFRDIAWSTPTVAATTRERAATLGWRLAQTRTLHDIDTPEDLRHWKTRP
ncbi:TIGR04282 family arsenosugar biosynthesis glycosyltransferase [Pseudazoarcus pumilus]|uniref:Glycosyltransferase n=1 Tax=Pseudazoarcus pumilus TaxID=2067960 RepID=A0A2I6S4N1_9RHOO|nr:TIGR04282 family arsenosugar biosynthesis glycosyltransferase [Pseudazoarcus pumilus]AUN94198.1 hypothetical protein C0099_04130 [Pseudazoarcus pumilus]